jgi:small subunit ribosomal protein S4
MARYCGPVCRLCRREGEKLFLKGDRCYSSKCAIERREGGPGQHGKGRQAFSNFKVQLRAKQKAKRMYGVLEKAFKRTFTTAASSKGVTGTEMLINLETRLDNIVYRLGFGISRREARQLVSHGHILVNGKRVTISSYSVSVGDTIEVQEKSKKDLRVQAALGSAESRMVPEWLSLDRAAAKGSLVANPTREQMPQNIKEQLVVELYSR